MINTFCLFLISFLAEGSKAPSITWHYSTGQVAASPAIADVEPDSAGSEIIFAAQHDVYCLSSNGNLIWSFPVGEEIFASPMVANLGAPGDPATIIIALDAKVYCLNNDGTLRWSFPGAGSSASSPIVANVDTVGPPEVIVTTSSYIYCLDNDGNEKWKASFSFMHLGQSPAVANIDKVGTPEILFSTYDSLYCLNSNGTKRWASYVTNDGPHCFGVAPSIGDVDLDGDPEIVFGDWCFEADGTLRWHYGLSSHSTSAIADVDDNGFPEVVTFCLDAQALYVFRDNGTPTPDVVWTAGAIDGSTTDGATPIICDIDGDGDKDVIWQGTSWLRIYDGATGTVLYENNALTSQTCNEHGVAVADVDGDGKIEMVAIYNDRGVALVEDPSWVNCDKNRFSGHVYHITGIDSDLSVPTIEPYSWEIHNTWLTQICEDPFGVGESEKLGMKNAKLEIHPNPSTVGVRVKWSGIGEKQEISLQIYDLSGRLVKSFPLIPNRSSLITDLSAGIYFLRVKTADKFVSKKLILL